MGRVCNRVERGVGERHGSEFRHRRDGLAAAGQLGPVAQIPHRAGPRDDEKARPWRAVVHVRRERPLSHRHADPGLEPAQAGLALCHAVRRRRADPVRAGRPRLPDRKAFAVDSEGERAPLLRLDQRRGRARLDPASDQIHQGGFAGDEGERRRRAKTRRRLHRHQHDRHFQGQQRQLDRRHERDDGCARRQERGRAGMLPHRRRHRRRDALGMHEIPAPRHHREPGDRASDAISLQHSRHGGRRRRHRLVGTEHLAELAQFLRPHHPARRHRVHGFGGADLERLQVLLLPHLLRRQGAEPGTERHLRDRAQMALRFRSAR